MQGSDDDACPRGPREACFVGCMTGVPARPAVWGVGPGSFGPSYADASDAKRVPLAHSVRSASAGEGTDTAIPQKDCKDGEQLN